MIGLLASPLIRYALTGLLASIAGFWLAWWLQSARVEAEALLHATASQDAQRWQQAAETRRAEIDRLNAEMEKLVKDHEDTQQAAFALVDEAQKRADETERRLAKLRKEGKDAPLNDTARAAADYGLCRARAIIAGTDPAGC